MIKPHHFIVLAGAALLSVLVALGLYANVNRWATGEIEGEPFLPGLAEQVASVSAIEITEGGRKLTLDRSGDAWKIREKAGYPVKTEAVRALMVAMVDARLIEAKTAIRSKLGLLELEDPGTTGAKSRGVRLLDKAGKPIVSVVVGKTRWDAFGSGRGGIYVRRADEAQSWLATGDPKVTADLTDWVETKVFAAEADKVTRLTVEHPGEAPLVIEKGPAPKPAEAAKDAKGDNPAAAAKADEKFHLVGMPEGKKLKSDVKIADFVDAFSSLELEDVKKLDATPTGDQVSVLKLEQAGAPTVTFRVRKDGDSRWISFEAQGGEGDIKKKADEINARAKGWEFKIPQWRGDQMLKRRADLFETS